MRNFKLALKRGGLFVLIVMLIWLAFAQAYFHGGHYYYLDAENRDALAGSLDTLIIGASEAMCDIRPDVLDPALGTHSYNLSGPLMSMRGRYDLLKYELARNPVKTVICDVSMNALARDRATDGPESDLYLLGRWSSAWQRLRFACGAFRVDDLPQVFYDTLDRGWQTVLAKLRGLPPQAPDIADRGWVAKPQAEVAALPPDDAYHGWKTYYAMTQENKNYLQKISDLCHENGATLILVSSPWAFSSLALYEDLQYVHDYYAIFARENGWQYLDCNLLLNRRDQLSEATAFYDDAHLCESAARTYTETLARLIAQPDESAFFRSYAALEQAYGYGQ